MEKKLSKQTRKQIINIAFLVLLIGITILVLFLSNDDFNLENIGQFLSGCDPWWIVAALVAMLFSVLFEAFSLHFILRGLGERPKMRSSIVYATSDIYYSAITPSATGGQPASAFYMVKDGIGAGKASFALVFNLIAYTLAIIIIGGVAFALRPEMYGMIDNWFARLLIILGFVLQSLLLVFFVICMFCGKAVLKCGNWIIALLVKVRLVKKPEKWREKLRTEVEKYKDCLHAVKKHPGMSFVNFFCNLGQRLSHVLVACFVCFAAKPQTDFIDLIVLESFVLVGYNSIPLPGGVGAFEFLYHQIYAISFADAFILSAMMVSRVISFYLRMLLSGMYTLIYHVTMIRRRPEQNTGGKENEERSEENG